jgi:hypothetical protein
MANLAMVMLVPILLVGAIENPSLGVLRLEERENELCIDEPIVPTSIGSLGCQELWTVCWRSSLLRGW